MDHQAASSSLPVFIQPTELKFIVSSPETHKRVITVYNPYDFGIRYSVLSNAPSKYRVVEPRGFIRPKCYIDIIIRHLAPTMASVDTCDCLRIQINREGDNTPCGRKDVPTFVCTTSEDTRNTNNEQFSAFPDSLKRGKTLQHRNVVFAANAAQIPNNASTMFTAFLISCLLACAVLLALPADTSELCPPCRCDETSALNERRPSIASAFTLDSIIPSYFRPSETSKKFAACVLGFATYALFQQNNH